MNQKIYKKKSLFSKISVDWVIPILRLQVMHDHVCYIARKD